MPLDEKIYLAASEHAKLHAPLPKQLPHEAAVIGFVAVMLAIWLFGLLANVLDSVGVIPMFIVSAIGSAITYFHFKSKFNTHFEVKMREYERLKNCDGIGK